MAVARYAVDDGGNVLRWSRPRGDKTDRGAVRRYALPYVKVVFGAQLLDQAIGQDRENLIGLRWVEERIAAGSDAGA